MPAIAINNHDDVVEVHRFAYGNDASLFSAHDAGMYDTTFDHARNQNLSIYEQLRYGIRYFDLRPMWMSRAGAANS